MLGVWRAHDPLVRLSPSTPSRRLCAAEVQLSSRPGPPPFQSGAPSRHSERLQAEALGGIGGVARPRGLNAAREMAVALHVDEPPLL
jgi:hypothetical protein